MEEGLKSGMRIFPEAFRTPSSSLLICVNPVHLRLKNPNIRRRDTMNIEGKIGLSAVARRSPRAAEN
jgi:hypothetical protein